MAASGSTWSTGTEVLRSILSTLSESLPPPQITTDASVKSFRPLMNIAENAETRISSRSAGQTSVTFPVSRSRAEAALIAPRTTLPSGCPIAASPLRTLPRKRSKRLSSVARASSSS
ncbi:MAG: hypothetical protein HY293_17485 [Planctomycetes bacterium]|nr:hypothetical protein [Planctomycetota bacterium]